MCNITDFVQYDSDRNSSKSKSSSLMIICYIGDKDIAIDHYHIPSYRKE